MVVQQYVTICALETHLNRWNSASYLFLDRTIGRNREENVAFAEILTRDRGNMRLATLVAMQMVCTLPNSYGSRATPFAGEYIAVLNVAGIIGRVYRQGQTITVMLEITANHFGWFEFRLCPNNDPRRPVTQRCLDK